MSEPENLLFVCTANRQRSPTAEALFDSHDDYEARSCGVTAVDGTQCNAELIEWADVIFCMEGRHRRILEDRFPELSTKQVVVLDIRDRYMRGEPQLIKLLRDRLSEWLETPE
mgnify:CR=1 FL=1